MRLSIYSSRILQIWVQFLLVTGEVILVRVYTRMGSEDYSGLKKPALVRLIRGSANKKTANCLDLRKISGPSSPCKKGGTWGVLGGK